eukprot:COSAG01_NODE_9340_length_2478_cov_4.725515_3_plen_53_part_00
MRTVFFNTLYQRVLIDIIIGHYMTKLKLADYCTDKVPVIDLDLARSGTYSCS